MSSEARRFEDVYQAGALAAWCKGRVDDSADHPCIEPGRARGGGKSHADIGDWIVLFSDGTVRIDRGGSQDGYCTDCGEPVWWRDGQLVLRSGLKWCMGEHGTHTGMTHHHALPGMAQYVVRSPDGQVCRCLDRAEPHIHQTIPITGIAER